LPQKSLPLPPNFYAASLRNAYILLIPVHSQNKIPLSPQ